jgi:hypothetical protein
MKNLTASLKAKNIVFIIFLQLFLYSSILSQWSFQISTNQEFNSNPFRSVQPTSDFISSFDIGVEKEFKDINFLYYGSYNKFNTSTDIDYYWHQLGIYNKTELITWGAYFEQRFNKINNNYFDYLNYAGYISKPFEFLSLNWEANISYSSMNYAEIPDFNSWIVASNILVRKSFETKTTIIGSALINYKGFKNYYYDVDSTITNENIIYGSEGVNITQLVLNLRLAQSLAENTGLALNYNVKHILSGSGLSASLIESTYGDIELYDDPVSQESYSIGGILTQIFENEMSIKLAYSYSDKNYPSQGIYLSEIEQNNDIKRQDKQSYFSATLTKPFYFDNENGSELDLNVNYHLIKNTSNSYFFNYDVSAVSLSLSFIF